MNRGFYTSVSGLSAARLGLTVTGHNMANVNTVGYVRQQSVQKDFIYQGVGNNNQVGMGTDIAMLRQIRDKFLDKSYRGEVGRASFYDVVYQTGNEMETIYGELQSAYSTQNITQDLWDAINELSLYPSGVETRTNFISTAISYITKMTNVYDRMIKEQLNLNESVKSSVTRINQLTTRINELNSTIPLMEASGQRANDYRDERNLCIDELSKLIKIEYVENIKGEVMITTNGQELVANGMAQRIGLRYTGPNSSLVEPVFSTKSYILDYDPTYSNARSLFNYSTIGSEFGNDSGELFGLMVARGLYPTNYASLQTPLFHGHGLLSSVYNADIKDSLQQLITGYPGLSALSPALPDLDTYLASVSAPPAVPTSTVPDPDDFVYGVRDPQYKAQYDTYLQDLINYTDAYETYVNDISGAINQYTQDTEQYISDNSATLNAADVASIRSYLADIQDTFDTNKADFDTFNEDVDELTDQYIDFKDNYRYFANFNATQCTIPKTMREMDLLFNYIVTLVNGTLDGIDLEDNVGVQIFTEKVVGKGLTMGNVEVNPILLEADGYNKLGLANSTDLDDGSKIAELMKKWKEVATIFETADKAYDMNIDDAYRFVIDNLATYTNKAYSYYKAQVDLVQEIDNKRMQISGVSLDEEMTNMMLYQHAYNAASRMVNIIDSMIDRIINGTGRSGL